MSLFFLAKSGVAKASGSLVNYQDYLALLRFCSRPNTICCFTLLLLPIVFLPIVFLSLFLCLNRNAWSKSGAPEARERCERALQRMEELYFEGQTELQPNTISFNTVLDALAQCTERDSARRAEQLLEHMDQLSSRDDRLSETCRPDVLSFNSVLNGWARSRDPMAAIRADDILKHMEQRYADGTSNVQPDAQSYNTVLTAWARSKSQGDTAVQNAQQVLQRMEKAYRRGNHRARPNTISYNIIINALAQSKDPTAVEHALEILETMKQRDTEHNNGASRPDCVTYTTIITVLAKKLSGQKEAAEQSIRLLEELEDMYLRTGDKAYKPNIRTYTAVSTVSIISSLYAFFSSEGKHGCCGYFL